MERQKITAPGPKTRYRTDGWILMVSIVAVLTPAVLGTAYLISKALLQVANSETRYWERIEKRDVLLLRAIQNDPEWSALAKLELSQHRIILTKSRQADAALTAKITPVIALGLTAVMVLIGWSMLSPPITILLSGSGATPLAEQTIEITRIVENLAEQLGIPVPKLYRLYSNIPNAFVGWASPTDPAVALTHGMLTLLDLRELTSVLAYEMVCLARRDDGLIASLVSVSLFLGAPLSYLRAEFSSETCTPISIKRRFLLSILVLSPVGIYVCLISPLLGAFFRWAVMRRRDLRADQRAVAITGDPEGLLLALGKVCGAASLGALAPAYSMHCFADTSRARTRRFGFVQLLRPAFGERMQRVADFAGVFDAATIRSALQKGKAYASDYAAPLSFDGGFGLPSDEVSRLKQGFVTGRVYRVLSQEDVPVYESPRPQAFVVATIQPKALVVVFDDLGGMRQVNTVDEVPGYIRRDVMLQAVTNVLPCEVYDPAIRRAVEERLSGRELGRPALPRLSRSQIWLTAAVVITVFMVVTGLLWLLGGH